MKIFLDDVRPLPEALRIQGGWVVVRTPKAFRDLIKDGLGGIEEISLDNDLGTKAGEGFQLLDEIERLVIEDGQPLPKLTVHSMNVVAKQRMLTVINRLNSR
jgi:hypothetical protein